MADTDRPMRSDARRNRELLVAVARRHLRLHGVTTSLEAIAREAGVGPGTLYRHFPDRDCLVAEVLRVENDELRAAGERIAREVGVAERLTPGSARWRDTSRVTAACPARWWARWRVGSRPLGPACEEIIATTTRFLAESQEAGVARPGVAAHDLVGCAAMLAWLGSTGPQGTQQADGARDILRHGYKVPG